ncbi:MAG: helicase-associated domain-containing protein [Gemmataceae bacterium]|nr:helicase-associated domain-containing protein [Gemmataceae bacterium]
MPPLDPAVWSDRLRRTLLRYDEPLLRQVAARLFKPRNQWPADELSQRSIATLQNAPVLDRRLADLEPACRQVLALIGHSRQARWPVGSLVELLVTLGQPDGLQPILTLLRAGLLYPDFGLPATDDGESAPAAARLKDFEAWLTLSDGGRPVVFAHPFVTSRLTWEALALPGCPGAASLPGTVSAQEADGLDWPLRLAVLGQQVAAQPVRRTQQGGFFKRDLERLRTDPLLNAIPPDSLATVPDVGLLAVELAVADGLLREADGELHAGRESTSGEEGLPAVVASLWAALLRIEVWNVCEGQAAGRVPGNPYPTVYLSALLLLGQLTGGQWVRPEALEGWLRERHPYWEGNRSAKAGTGCGVGPFLLGLAYQLRLVQAARDADGAWVVRLALLGRWLVGQEEPPALAGFPQTLLVQPNLEILAYRQGLTPALVAQLSRLATWTGLGPACTLQLQPESVYRALEAGESFETILQALNRHGMKPVPDPVINSLRTWANKRERIQVYGAAALFEFNSPEDLNEALARGLPAVRLSDRLAVVARESDIEYRHFRLTATRDYTLPPEKCVEVESDGVTLGVDASRSDLLVETEVRRFAEPVERHAANGRRYYRLTPETVAAGREQGLTPQALEAWFVQRGGQPLPPAARLLLAGPHVPPLEMRRLQVLYVPTAEVADGLQQWPGTRALIEGRLGPTALVVAEENTAALRERLHSLGIRLGSGREE